MNALKMFIYWSSWFYFLAAPALLFLIATRRGVIRLGAGVVLVGLSCLAWARFVEPRILLTVEHVTTLQRCFPLAGAARIAVFSDTHEGMFDNAMPVARIVRRLNWIAPDAILVPGDFTYYLPENEFEAAFGALRDAKAPVYAVLGNHDIGLPNGPDVGVPLTAALVDLGVNMIDDQPATILSPNGELEVVGLSDLWGLQQKRELASSPTDKPRLVLTHNPDTILEFPAGAPIDLLVAGHTHGGQINLPVVTCALMRFACTVVRYGFAETPAGRVFVTSGTGMVGLPMRFNQPPRIDVLDISWRACGSD